MQGANEAHFEDVGALGDVVEGFRVHPHCKHSLCPQFHWLMGPRGGWEYLPSAVGEE